MMEPFIRMALSVVTVIMCQVSALSAQNDNKISLLAMVKKDTIILRWAPASVASWQVGISSGYIIKRYTIARDGNFIPDGLANGKILTEAPIKPENNNFFENLSASDKRALIIQEAIYSKDFRPSSTADFMSFRKEYEDLEVRLGFALFMCDLSPELARAAGLSFIDTNISENERYIYSVSPVDVPESMKIDQGVIVVDADRITAFPEITDIQTIFIDKAVTFRWPIIFHKGIYSAYIIEKSTNGKTYFPVSDLPLVNFSENPNQDYFIYTDSLKSNNQKYFYRIKGLSPFGQTGPPSAAIEGKGVPDFSAYVTVDTAILLENNKIKIQWSIVEDPASPVSSVSVLRSDSYNGNFEIINSKPLDVRSRSFTDPKPRNSNYYQVKLIGRDNQQSISFPYFIQTEDNDPPSPPEMLAGSVDSSGAVTIIWKANSEPDLLGYKIFRGNSSDDEFIALEQGLILTNLCYDTVNLNTLSSKIYYQAIAIDKNYNNSDYSMLLELSRPDTIDPAPAIISRISYNEGKVLLEQEASPSTDISHYELYLKTEDDTRSVLVQSWTKLPMVYEDSPSIKGRILEYTLHTFDLNGNNSRDDRKIFVPQESSKTLILSAEQSSDGGIINISWNVPEGFIPVKTIIYRSTEDEPVSLYITIVNSEQFFIDKKVEINTKYNYRIVLYNATGSNYAGKLTVIHY